MFLLSCPGSETMLSMFLQKLCGKIIATPAVAFFDLEIVEKALFFY
jgi:hypothetical protein